MKFKIGDRVKIIKEDNRATNFSGLILGDEFIVEEVSKNWYRPTKGKSTGIQEHMLELVSSKPESKPKSMEQLLTTYYEYCKSHVVKHRESLENQVKRERLELDFLKKIEQQSLIQNSDVDRKIYIERELKTHTDKLSTISVAEKNLRRQNIVADFQSLNHHAFIEKVEVKDDCLNVYTKKLKVQGCGIGDYLIKIPIQESFGDTLLRIRITNLQKKVATSDYNNIFDHWFVENEIPCFAEWGSIISNYLLKGNLLLAVTNLIHFLLSTGKGGYLTMDSWIFKFSGERIEKTIPPVRVDEVGEEISPTATTAGIPADYYPL